jgi:hypothetical protein
MDRHITISKKKNTCDHIVHYINFIKIAGVGPKSTTGSKLSKFNLQHKRLWKLEEKIQTFSNMFQTGLK